MRDSHTMSVRSRWLNFIMHLTAAIAERKQDLTKYHAIKSFFDLITIVLLEGVLAIVSIPLYFSFKTETLQPDNEFNVQYAIRKTLTFTFFVLLAAIFVIKILIVLVSIGPTFQDVQNMSVTSAPVHSEEIFNIVTSPVNSTTQPPVVLSISKLENSSFEVIGKSKPLTNILLQIIPALNNDERTSFHIYSTQSDESGNWKIAFTPDGLIPSGHYLFQAQSFDVTSRSKSVLGSSMEYEFTPTLYDSLFNFLDSSANILLLSFVCIGFLVVFLTF